MVRDLDLTVSIVGGSVSITVGEPESGLAKTFTNELPIRGRKSDRIFEDVADEIWSWIDLWMEEQE